MRDRRQPNRTGRLMAAVALLEAEARDEAGPFPVCDLAEAEIIDRVAALAGAAARRRVRICLEQGPGSLISKHLRSHHGRDVE